MATRKRDSSDNGRNARQQQQQQQQRSGQGRAQEQLTAQLSERAAELAEQAEELTHRARQMAWQADRRFRSTVDRRPMTFVWTSFGIGIGVGLALVALLPSGRSSARGKGGWTLGHLPDSLHHLSERAGRAGRSMVHQASSQAHDLGESASRRAREAAGYLGF